MSVLTRAIAWLNSVADAVGEVVLAPISALPGWLSATLVAVVTGVLMLIAFKYTSNQAAIKRVRAGIKANTLSLKLFKESALVAIQAQRGMVVGAFWLLIYAIVPILVMTVPVLLILSQLALWYQSRPLQSNEDAVITVKLRAPAGDAMPEVRPEPNSGLEFKTRSRIFSQNEVCWDVRAKEEGYHQLQFRVGDQTYSKELAVGAGMMRVSVLRPGYRFMDVLLNPAETPFDESSPVQSIKVSYPERAWFTRGAKTRVWNWVAIAWDWLASLPGVWVWYWLIVSMVAAFCFKGVFKVNI